MDVEAKRIWRGIRFMFRAAAILELTSRLESEVFARNQLGALGASIRPRFPVNDIKLRLRLINQLHVNPL